MDARWDYTESKDINKINNKGFQNLGTDLNNVYHTHKTHPQVLCLRLILKTITDTASCSREPQHSEFFVTEAKKLERIKVATN